MKKLLVTALSFMSVIGCQPNVSQKISQTNPFIEVRLRGGIKSVTGVNWDMYNDGRYQESKLINYPCNLQITLPSGRQLQYKALNADLDQENLVVETVYVRLPLMTDDYYQAVVNLENELANLSPKSRERCTEGFSKLRNVNPIPNYGGEQLGCFFDLEEGIHLRAGIKTVVDNGKSRWITFLEFSLSENWKRGCCAS